jgi:hypothetical protein
VTAAFALDREWEDAPPVRPPAYDTGWTMDRFVDWTFGSRQLTDAARLVREIEAGLDALQRTPEDPALRRSLARWMMALRDRADRHRLGPEADVAASLVVLSGAGEAPPVLVRELRAGLRVIAAGIGRRMGTRRGRRS